MIKEIYTRITQGKRTILFPKGAPPAMPLSFKGKPHIDISKCTNIDSSTCSLPCTICSAVCPSGAINPSEKTIDLGKCIFCGECSSACPSGAVSFSKDYRLSVRSRNDLVMQWGDEELRLADALKERLRSLFGRSLKIRVVSAGGCGACEADVNVLGTIGWDLGRFGIQYVASPRHADALLIIGPITKNMETAVKKTYDAIPEPKLVIAVGSCAVSGGLYAGIPSEENDAPMLGGAPSFFPVDLYIPGCPPHPLTILDGLLRLLGRIKR